MDLAPTKREHPLELKLKAITLDRRGADLGIRMEMTYNGGHEYQSFGIGIAEIQGDEPSLVGIGLSLLVQQFKHFRSFKDRVTVCLKCDHRELMKYPTEPALHCDQQMQNSP
jgi:hypothetical protein